MEYKLNYDVTKEDYLSFNEAHIKKSRVGGFLSIACEVYIFLCVIFSITVQIFSKNFSFASVILVLVLGFIFFARKLWRKKRINKVYDSNKSLHQQNEVTVDEETISETNPVSSLSMNKSQIIEIVEGKNGIYIYYSKLQSFLIPVHAFNSIDEFNKFVEFVKTNYSNEKVKFIQCKKTSVWLTIFAVLTGIGISALFFGSIMFGK